MTADVRVGIVSWNTAPMLEKALCALPAALGRLDAEIVVVDNASDDDSVEVARGQRGVQVVTNTSNVGYARAMNQALAGTEARALIALNPDTEAPAGSLEQLVRTLDENRAAGLVAPVLTDASGKAQRSVFPYPGPLEALETGFLPRSWRRGSKVASVADGSRVGASRALRLKGLWVLGAVHCIRRAALDGKPPYSSRWFMYVEDIELCWRLRTKGWDNLLRLDVSIVHHGNAAGVQRWGEGASLELRSIPNIYEWLRSERSPATVRATGLVNRAALATKRRILRIGSTYSSRNAAAWKERATELEGISAHHRAESAKVGGDAG